MHRRRLSRGVGCVLMAVYVAAQPGVVCGLACLARGHGAHATTAGHDHHTPIATACHSAALGPAASLPVGFELGPSVLAAVPVLPIAPGDSVVGRAEPATFGTSYSPDTDPPPPRS